MSNAKRAHWSSDPGFRRFVKNAQRHTRPKILDSAYVMAVAPTGGTADIKMALEIGLAILMDKPLIVLRPKGRVVAERLLRIADHVIESDMDTEEGREATMERLKQVLKQ